MKKTGTDHDSEVVHPPHQGKLLSQLIDWMGITMEEFAGLIGYSRRFLIDSKKNERIPYKHQVVISKACNVPMNYWDGEYELPVVLAHAVSEPAIEYGRKSKDLEKIIALQDGLIESLQGQIKLLQEQIDGLRSQLESQV